MEFLLDHLPPALHLVLASRSDPPLPLARLRARGQLVELRAGDLRFTAEEAAQLLRTEVGAHLTDPVVTALGDRTEGWAAGLHLAALSLRGRGDVTRFVAEFSGSHRFVLDYLTEEVLERLPAELRTFLLETSVLDRLCGPLCDAVVGRPRRPAAAGVGRAGQPVPDPARRGAPVVALPPPLRRSAPRQPGSAAPAPRAGAAPRGGGVVRRARPARRRHPARAGRGRHRPRGRARRGAPRGAGVAARPGRHHRRLARRAARRGDPPQAVADPRAGGRGPHGGQAGRGRAAPRRGRAGAGAHPGRRPTARRSTAGSACWPTSRRASRCAGPTWPGCAATSRPSRRSPVPRSPTSPSRTSCSARSRATRWRSAISSRAGWWPPSARSRACSPSGSRPRSTTWCRAPRSTSAPPSSPGGASAPRCAPTSRGCGSRRAIDRRRPRACCTSGSPRCTSNATSWPTRTGWSPRASSSAAGSRTSRP